MNAYFLSPHAGYGKAPENGVAPMKVFLHSYTPFGCLVLSLALSQVLLGCGGRAGAGGVLPPDTFVAFKSREGAIGIPAEIMTMNSDGTNVRNVTNNPADDDDPAVSPDGARIAFRSNRDGDYEIFVMNRDGSNVQQLTFNTAGDNDPAWSPDGLKIAFTSWRDGNENVYLMNADGSNQKRLAGSPLSDDDPAFSSDGRFIAFESGRDGGPDQIYIMSADGANQVRLTNDPFLNEDPEFLPDGGILYHSDRNGVKHIFQIDADRSAVSRVTNDFGGKNPSVSPDGDKVVFSRQRDGDDEIFVMNVDGTGLTQLTHNGVDDDRPSIGAL
jgi:Tol biopolymer transport system component